MKFSKKYKILLASGYHISYDIHKDVAIIIWFIVKHYLSNTNQSFESLSDKTTEYRQLLPGEYKT